LLVTKGGGFSALSKISNGLALSPFLWAKELIWTQS